MNCVRVYQHTCTASASTAASFCMRVIAYTVGCTKMTHSYTNLLPAAILRSALHVIVLSFLAYDLQDNGKVEVKVKLSLCLQYHAMKTYLVLN